MTEGELMTDLEKMYEMKDEVLERIKELELAVRTRDALLESELLYSRRLRADLLRMEGELARHKGNALTILHNLRPQDGGIKKDQVCDDPLGTLSILCVHWIQELDRLRSVEGELRDVVKRTNDSLPPLDRVSRDRDVEVDEDPLSQLNVLLSTLVKEVTRLREADRVTRMMEDQK